MVYIKYQNGNGEVESGSWKNYKELESCFLVNINSKHSLLIKKANIEVIEQTEKGE